MEAGASVNARDRDGRTPLHYLMDMRRSKGEFEEAAHQMLRRCADVNAADEEGMTPLMVASSRAFDEGGELLLSLGADVTVRTSCSSTCLHIVGHCLIGDCVSPLLVRRVLRLLVDAGADKDALDNNDDTPLDEALWCSNTIALVAMLSEGLWATPEGEHWCVLMELFDGYQLQEQRAARAEAQVDRLERQLSSVGANLQHMIVAAASDVREAQQAKARQREEAAELAGQREELRLQRVELRMQREELQLQREELQLQSKELQRLEGRFKSQQRELQLQPNKGVRRTRHREDGTQRVEADQEQPKRRQRRKQ